MSTKRVLLSALTVALLASGAFACQRTPRESVELGDVATAGDKARREELELRTKEEAFAEVKRSHLKSRSQATLAEADSRTAAIEASKRRLVGSEPAFVKAALDAVATARVALTDEIAKLDDASPRALSTLSPSVEKAEAELVTAVTAYEAAVARS